ncbi:MaoC family dehydratase [Pelagibacterium lacus]|uniref:3-alpha,7-alpha, 12-alpha-trihydroxy-5-beta-cholest-24-enoyl-CoA hydratase n=1 Tax=Pelagibacterium lacus TaxID=2282655 RepID=A0A369W4E0_9HYPH|nr:MaoC family dehydratase [Pelagibacterium lacus]RDE09566.1 3-alpha,7-alpha,12-alpha-trihydroxy-5-beta-cholest-24-enoyl-CoA hydratase [Pelagibacterium lacus]
MALNIEALRAFTFPELRQTYDDRDSMLYAASLGFGQDPLDAGQLKFVFERDLHAVPTMAAILCHPGTWSSDPVFAITRSKVVHGAQRVFLHAPLPPAAELVADARILAVEDKGEKGAIIHVVRTMRDASSGTPIASVLHATFCRADGGFGGGFGEVPAAHTLPDRAPDMVVELETRPEAALIYRLNIDRNPLHADPEYARRAGFPRPILHGLCTYGLAARALLAGVLDYDSDLLRSIECRFSAPVFPGETIAFEIWRDGDVASFRAVVREREAKVLDAGRALIGADVETPLYARQ